MYLRSSLEMTNTLLGKRRRQRHEYLSPALVASKPSLTFVLLRQTLCSLPAHQISDTTVFSLSIHVVVAFLKSEVSEFFFCKQRGCSVNGSRL